MIPFLLLCFRSTLEDHEHSITELENHLEKVFIYSLLKCEIITTVLKTCGQFHCDGRTNQRTKKAVGNN